jgi:transcriptional/translational regulatory protein YebC/TACO1
VRRIKSRVVCEGTEGIIRRRTLISTQDALKIMKVIDLFEEDDDVQNVFHNLEITDELIESM